MLYQFYKRQYNIGLLSITFLLGGFGANGFEYYRRDFFIILLFWGSNASLEENKAMEMAYYW